jgi:hypothetical protein
LGKPETSIGHQLGRRLCKSRFHDKRGPFLRSRSRESLR